MRARVNRRWLASSAVIAVLSAGGNLTLVGEATADEPSRPPGSEVTPPPPEIDPNAPGLKLADGAELAPPKVLDIKFVTETYGTPDTGGGDQETTEPEPTPSETTSPEPRPKPEEQTTERQEVSNSNTRFTLQSDLLFPKDSAKLNKAAYARIKEIAQEINKHGPSEVNVFGFTDNLGSYEHGKVLSKKRAEAVHRQLLKDVKNTDITFNIRGYSEDYPIADNSTEAGRQKNRRVEISFPLTKD